MKINESQLRKIIKENTNKVLNKYNTKPNELINEDFNMNSMNKFGMDVENLMRGMKGFANYLGDYYKLLQYQQQLMQQQQQLMQQYQKLMQQHQQLMQGGNQQQVSAQQSQ